MSVEYAIFDVTNSSRNVFKEYNVWLCEDENVTACIISCLVTSYAEANVYGVVMYFDITLQLLNGSQRISSTDVGVVINNVKLVRLRLSRHFGEEASYQVATKVSND